MKPRRSLLVLLLGALSLSACGAVRYKTVCPTLVSYSLNEQTQLAQELAAMPAATMTHRAVRDYAGLRDQVRVCQAGGK
ncbi:hypothetical protein [Acetobacter orientalis]|uniref:hypothetical protein n=1 Tax=Acetobacter orientalis TaxID=146474 RepID=UPI00241FAD7D|nr:hypothetical protein [Acetobacter orientalis]